MLISSVDGIGFRYEVMARSDGYLVQVMDYRNGAHVANEERLFRTAPAAFAYVDYAAARNIADAALPTCESDDLQDLSESREHFSELSRDLADNGVSHAFLAAWEGSAARTQRRMYH